MDSKVTEPAAIVPLDAAVRHDALSCSVAGEPALARVVGSLLVHLPLHRVVVAAAAADLAGAARSTLTAAGLSDVAVLEAAGTRSACVAAGLTWLRCGPQAPVLVHDHRCPLTSADVTGRVLEALAAGHSVVAPVLAVTDTVKRIDAGGTVRETVDRQSLRTAQHPRGYRAATLRGLLDRPGFDELSTALGTSTPIATVAGDVHGITADLPADAALLEAVLATRVR